MKPNDYDLRIIEIVGALRVLAKQKQANLASLLKITQPEYSRIEKGQRALTVGHLYEICTFLEISIDQVVKIAEATLALDFDKRPIDYLLIQLTSTLQNREIPVNLGKNDFEFILRRIRESKRHALCERTTSGIEDFINVI